MVVASRHVVDSVGTRTMAHVADAAMDTQDPLPLRVPRCGQPDPTVTAFPASGSHARASGISNERISPWTPNSADW